MSNLFQSFDPSSSLGLSIQWISSFMFILMILPLFWVLPNRSNLIINMFFQWTHEEFKSILGKNYFNITLLGSTFMLFIMMNNFMGLFSYIFTSSSHLVMTLSLALPFWFALMLFGWMNKTVEMLAHTLPMSTPVILMPFMVLVETISNFIRPITLAVRLAANMIAGHLLLTLLGNQGNTNFMIYSLVLTSQLLLITLESAVALIQSYVFATLTMLYSSEIC
uniref:ATP synthase F0 subunit 6 n=1 Tax=Lynceus grossipedia TaxID=2774322 RepID=UPI0023AA97E7|nr:ATP synthase F0 subunit 6 [Lynceus grossipedia]WCD23722.1 ATP synthase F0 subunit 6 [Lynceus grossipedia]